MAEQASVIRHVLVPRPFPGTARIGEDHPRRLGGRAPRKMRAIRRREGCPASPQALRAATAKSKSLAASHSSPSIDGRQLSRTADLFVPLGRVMIERNAQCQPAGERRLKSSSAGFNRCIGFIALVSVSTRRPAAKPSSIIPMLSGFMNGSPPVKPISMGESLRQACFASSRILAPLQGSNRPSDRSSDDDSM